MSDSVQPHRRQPTRLPRPWDSPGKNTGVGCHFLLQCMKVKMKLLSHVWLLVTPWTAAHQAPLSMGLSRQEYWSGVPFPPPGIFPLQGLNPSLPHCRQTLYPLSHQGKWKKPRIKEQALLWFHLYNMSRIGKSIEIESRLMVARVWLLMNGKWLCNKNKFPLGMTEMFWN